MKRFIPSLLSVALACASLESMAAADLIITNAKVLVKRALESILYSRLIGRRNPRSIF